MAVLNVQRISGGTATVGTGVINYSGLTPAAAVAAQAGGDSIPNATGRVWAEVTNASGLPITVTVDQVKPDSQGRTLDPVITIPASTTVRFGPFEPYLFNDVSDRVNLSYSAVAAVTIRCFELAGQFA